MLRGSLVATLLAFVVGLLSADIPRPTGSVDAAFESLSRTLGRDASTLFEFMLDVKAGHCYTLSRGANESKVAVLADSAVDLVYGVGGIAQIQSILSEIGILPPV